MNEKEIKELKKAWRKYGISTQYFVPFILPLQIATHVIMSIRSTGKTTGIIILALLMYKLFGSNCAYVRSSDDMITRKRVISLFDTIIECGYIAKIFGDQYDNVFYDAQKFYLYNTKTDTKSDIPFMYLLSIDRHEYYKSTLNAPRCRIVILDEFIHRNTRQYEFQDFLDLLKTIIRSRLDVTVFMLANTLSKESLYYSEMGIYDDIKKLEPNKVRTVTTELGTTISLLLLSDPQPDRTIAVNSKYFGFQNSRLQHITGIGGIWSQVNYQKPPSDYNEGRELIESTIYVEKSERYCKIDIYCTHDILWALVHWCDLPHNDSLILTNSDIKDFRFLSFQSNNAINKLIRKLNNENRIFYACNDVGEFFDDFLKGA